MAPPLLHCVIMGAAVVLALAALGGCGGDEPDERAVATIPALGAQTAPASTPPVGTSTVPSTSRRTTTGTQASPPASAARPAPPRTQTQPPRQLSAAEADASSNTDARQLATSSGSERCPDILEDGAGVKDIVVVGTSCGRARLVVFSGGRGADAGGFRCDIVAESFDDVPTILYSCARAADDARIRYTAVG